MNPIQQAVKESVDRTREGLRLWLKAATNPGTPIVDGFQYEPKPVYPYVSFGFLGTLVKLGRADSLVFDRVLNKFILRAHRQATISINAHGKPYEGTYNSLYRATDILAGVQMHIDEPTAYGFLQTRNIAILGDNGVVDTTLFQENVWMPRANLDLLIGISFHAEIQPGWIERVEVSGNLDTTLDGQFSKEFGPYTYAQGGSE
jgi:hypothetical protein